MTIMLALALVAQTGDGAGVARQTSVPVDQVLGHDLKPSREEREDARERKRHDKSIEKELRRMRKDKGRFSLPRGPGKVDRFRQIAPDSNHY